MRKKVTFVLLSGLICLSGCINNSQAENVTPRQMANSQSNIILQGIIEEDVETVKELFCPYVIENYPNLEEQIEGMFDFIDGEIVSYDEPDGAKSSCKRTEWEGTVEETISGEITNIKTSTGKIYRMGHGAYSVYKEYPQYVGVNNITIFDEDMYNAETGYSEAGKYIIHFPEIYE